MTTVVSVIVEPLMAASSPTKRPAWSTVIQRSTWDLPSTVRSPNRPSLTYPSCDRPSRTRSREPCSVVLIAMGHHYKNGETERSFQRSSDVTVKVHHQGSFITSLEISEMTSPEMMSARCGLSSWGQAGMMSAKCWPSSIYIYIYIYIICIYIHIYIYNIYDIYIYIVKLLLVSKQPPFPFKVEPSNNLHNFTN